MNNRLAFRSIFLVLASSYLVAAAPSPVAKVWTPLQGDLPLAPPDLLAGSSWTIAKLDEKALRDLLAEAPRERTAKGRATPPFPSMRSARGHGR